MFSLSNKRRWFSSALMKKQEITAYILIISALIAACIYSINVGFITRDSWKYLEISESLLDHGSCTIDGSYYAMFPCGYPFLIAIISAISGFIDTFTASKIANLGLVFCSAILIHRASKNILLAFFIIVNPLTLKIFHFTVSENALLFSLALSYYAIVKIHEGYSFKKYAAVLSIALIIGISSRYAFAPLAFIIFITSFIVYGKNLAIRSFPIFAVSGIFFLSYLTFNHYKLGFSTGMPRIDSPESISFLILYFILFNGLAFVLYFGAIIPAWFSVFREFKEKGLSQLHLNVSQVKESPIFFFFVLGLIYLTVLFFIRLRTQYDLYDTRTIGYSLVFIYSSVLCFIFDRYKINMSSKKLALITGLSLFISQPFDYFRSISGTQTYIDFSQMKENYKPANLSEEIETVVYLSVPEPSIGIPSSPILYYKGKNSIMVDRAPYYLPETPESLKQKISLYNGSCVYDFSSFNNIKELEAYLNRTHRSDIDFSSGLIPSIISRPMFDENIKQHIYQRFSPGSLVPCNKAGNA
ncbi:MAG: hypothetical protein OIF57_17025 [Marinobacterium sp.]|nr:hypothetical protein [Marinobacterium sp.]